jgi:predicted secreted protein
MLIAHVFVSGVPAIGLAQDATEAAGERIIDMTDLPVDRPVRTEIGDILELRLSGNVSTGYAWTYIDAGKEVVENLGKHRVEHAMRDGRPLIGGASTQIWRLRASAPGCQAIRFVYSRPWQQDEAPVRTVAYRILVSQSDESGDDVATRASAHEVDCD